MSGTKKMSATISLRRRYAVSRPAASSPVSGPLVSRAEYPAASIAAVSVCTLTVDGAVTRAVAVA